jgi:uncharacterized Tic20 family protein
MTQALPQPGEPSSDDRLLAGLAHLFGLWVALIIWFLQKDKSPYVKFQALQSVAYSLLLMALSLLAAGLYLAFMLAGVFGGLLVAAAATETGGGEAWLSGFMFLLPALVWMIFIPLGLLSWIPRLVAAVQTLMGNPFRYPWLGWLVEKFLKNDRMRV